MHPVSDDSAYRKTWFSWALYDVANSAFYLVVVGTIFPIFYRTLYVHREASSGVKESILRENASSSLALTAGLAMLAVAVLGPILGTFADRMAAKKKFLAIFAAVGVVSSGLMYFIGPTQVLFAAVLYATGTIGVAGSIVFYDALLPSVARAKDVDRISTIGFAMGYAGSVLLLILNLAFIEKPEWFGLADRAGGVRLSFLTVAIWWAVFSLPLLLKVPEPPNAGTAAGGNPILDGFRQLGRTFRKIRKYRQLLLYLAAYWIYIDGIGTIIKLAVSYGDSLHIKEFHLILALIITQVVGIPCALAFGWLARPIGAKNGILIGLAGYLAISVFAMFISRTWHFYTLAIGVGVVQGGVQALSRSLFASMTPAKQAAEFFGFFSTMAKFAGIVGPFLLAFVWSWAGDSREVMTGAMLSVFFIVGGLLLTRVNVDEGRRVAAEEADAA